MLKIEPTFIKDLYVLHRHVHQDERGIFNRFFAADELAAVGISAEAVHINSSTSTSMATLRGIHFQYPPFAEGKIVSCAAGAVWDVGIDLRPDSPTRFKWFGTKLTPKNGVSLIVPEGFGHAFITLEPNSTVVYVVSAVYAPDHESGIMYDDPLLKIEWPIQPTVISEKDRSWDKIEKRLKELDSGFSKSN
jgi:dTDP-4-dehydrorhamnose 3,5-epimerase